MISIRRLRRIIGWRDVTCGLWLLAVTIIRLRFLSQLVMSLLLTLLLLTGLAVQGIAAQPLEAQPWGLRAMRLSGLGGISNTEGQRSSSTNALVGYQPAADAEDVAGDRLAVARTSTHQREVPSADTTQVTVASGLTFDFALAVDKRGDVYAITSGINGVVEIPAGRGSWITIASGPPCGSNCTDYASGVAVNGHGDVYIAWAGDRVIEVPAGGGRQITVATSSTVWGIGGVAVDDQGNVYIAESVAGTQVVKLPAGDGSQATVVASGLFDPAEVGVDGQGNMYIADTAHNRVVEVPAGGNSQMTVVASDLRESQAITHPVV